MVVVLLSFWSVREIVYAASLDPALVILTVALAVSLPRVLHTAARPAQTQALLIVPAAAIAAFATTRLMATGIPVLGDAVFTLALAATVYVRRFGRSFIRPGILTALPFVAQLVTPVISPQRPFATSLAWSALVALICTAWTLLLLELTRPTAGIHSPPPRRSSGQRHRPLGRRTADPPPTRRTAIRAGKRTAEWMAVRLAVALGLAFVAGRSFFAEHWMLPVLTAYVVSSGTGPDTLRKGALRVAGAAGGTAVASLCGGLFATGSSAYVVLIFVVLAIGCALRELSYAYWAAAATAVLALLYDYLGEGGTGVLLTRMAGIVTGGVIAVLAAALRPGRRRRRAQ